MGVTNRRYSRKIFKGFIYSEILPFVYDPKPFGAQGLFKIYEGYWQSFKYLEPIRDSLIEEFIPLKKLPMNLCSILTKIQNSNSVAIHVRRGDYIGNPHANAFHGVLDKSYYRKAIDMILQSRSTPEFFVFSDDLEWCKEELQKIYSGTNFHFLDCKLSESYFDLYLMSNCKDFIIANSSFSWWGAWLGQYRNKIVFTPKNWTNFHNSEDLLDFIPSNWKIV